MIIFINNESIKFCRITLHIKRFTDKRKAVPFFCLKMYMEKCGLLHFNGNNLRNGSSYALNQYRTLIGNRIRRIKLYHLRAPTTTGSARNRDRDRSNSAISIAWLSCRAISASGELVVRFNALAYRREGGGDWSRWRRRGAVVTEGCFT